jgi:hypothetical protein
MHGQISRSPGLGLEACSLAERGDEAEIDGLRAFPFRGHGRDSVLTPSTKVTRSSIMQVSVVVRGRSVHWTIADRRSEDGGTMTAGRSAGVERECVRLAGRRQ